MMFRDNYYSDGKRKKMIDAWGNVVEFDARCHQTAIDFPDNDETRYTYEEHGNRLKTPQK